ncbi:MAG: SDR family NAD(P)-dependent oxidoreductase [Reichenbachiella sp.]|uniref:SDR family NAD(P)-dependent oxidoreductase n=1 Tax=Reichenbachiella sp. TaxID=2184521 RepID=UPI0032983606
MTKGNILITGASTGIGAACAKKFINEGYAVYGSVRKQEDADRLVEEMGNDFHPLLFDVTDEAAIKKVAAELTTELDGQGLQLLINNAGIAVTGAVELLDIDAFRKQYEVNYFGLIAVTKAFLPLLGAIENCSFESGKIINMSSIASKRTMPFMTPYAGSKAAVDSFTEGLRRELMIYGIDAVTINPGPIRTPIWEKIDVKMDLVGGTIYEPILKRFIKLVDKESKDAIEADVFANRVFKTFQSKKPKVSDVVIKNKLLKYNLLSLISARRIDEFIKKILKI